MSEAPTVRLDIVSDVVCPWCIVGFLQLQQALIQLPLFNGNRLN